MKDHIDRWTSSKALSARTGSATDAAEKRYTIGTPYRATLLNRWRVGWTHEVARVSLTTTERHTHRAIATTTETRTARDAVAGETTSK